LTAYVADQGIGIPAHEQGKLFDSFYRADSGLRRKTKGTGLGLYLSKAIVEAHDGQIWVRSEPGQGSTFFFTLPQTTRGTSETSQQMPDATPSQADEQRQMSYHE
jgi:signal transduction histidine kinase